MDFSGMCVQQNGQLYSVFTPNGEMVCQVFCGADQQYLLDAKVLQYICKIMAKRWRITKN